MEIPTMADFSRLESEIAELKTMLQSVMIHSTARQTVTVSDICQIEGVSKPQILKTERYLLPNFGLSGYPTGRTRWDLETYLKWRARPAEERKRMFISYLEKVRKDGEKEIKKVHAPN